MLILLAVLLAGCTAAPTSTAGAGHRVQPDCLAPHASSETVPLAGFTVSWVLLCPFRRAGGPQLTLRADTSAAELVRQLMTPDGPPPKICTDELVTVPFFALVDAAGHAIRPVVPDDGCHPSKAVRDALDALPFRTVKTENR